MKKSFLLLALVVFAFLNFHIFADQTNRKDANEQNVKAAIELTREEKEAAFFARFEDNHVFTNDEVMQYYEAIGEPVLEVEDEIEVADEYFDIRIKPMTSSPDTWFMWRKWINRNGVWSLSLKPGPGKVSVMKQHPQEAWAFIYEKHRNSRHWLNYLPEADESMQLQFEFHLYVAQEFKTPWNLEPSKKVKDLDWLFN